MWKINFVALRFAGRRQRRSNAINLQHLPAKLWTHVNHRTRLCHLIWPFGTQQRRKFLLRILSPRCTTWNVRTVSAWLYHRCETNPFCSDWFIVVATMPGVAANEFARAKCPTPNAVLTDSIGVDIMWQRDHIHFHTFTTVSSFNNGFHGYLQLIYTMYLEDILDCLCKLFKQ